MCVHTGGCEIPLHVAFFRAYWSMSLLPVIRLLSMMKHAIVNGHALYWAKTCYWQMSLWESVLHCKFTVGISKAAWQGREKQIGRKEKLYRRTCTRCVVKYFLWCKFVSNNRDDHYSVNWAKRKLEWIGLFLTMCTAAFREGDSLLLLCAKGRIRQPANHAMTKNTTSPFFFLLSITSGIHRCL